MNDFTKFTRLERLSHIERDFHVLIGYIALINIAVFIVFPSKVFANILIILFIIFLTFMIILRVYFFILKRSFLRKIERGEFAWIQTDPIVDSVFESHIPSIEHTLLPFPDISLSDRDTIDQFVEKVKKTEEIPKLTFVINEFLSLKLENNTTHIYIKNQRFNQCKFLLMNIDPDEIEKYDEIESIDDLDSYLDRSLENEEPYDHGITPEQEFRGHCSNLQVWDEYDYDTRILHSNLAFPLLKKLTEVGDPKAKSRFKEEIVKRYLDGNKSVRGYLRMEGYLNFLTIDEIVFLVRGILERDGKIELKINLVKDNFRLVSLANGEDVSEFVDTEFTLRDGSETLTGFGGVNSGRLEVPHEDDNLGEFSELSEIEFSERNESENEKEKEEGSEGNG